MSQPLEARDSSLITRDEPEEEITSFAVIRTETVLSKFPLHNLSKHGKIAIAISKKARMVSPR